MSASNRIIAIVGETATGKTEIGEAVADALGGEVVCADSRQVFADLDIGTGKADEAARARRPHHLFDALHVGDPASAGWYLAAAREACAGIHARGNTAVLVGGSGLYLGAARDGIAAAPPADPVLRATLQAEAAGEGSEALHDRLTLEDPETSARLAPRDTQRVIRALEVLGSSGRPLSWWHRQPHAAPVAGEWLVLQVTCPLETLRERIARRTTWMFSNGMMDETRSLLRSERSAALRALKAIGYDEAIAIMDGTLDRAAAEARTSLRTIQFAKRQRTWFRNRGRPHAVHSDGAAGILKAIRSG